MHVFESSCRVLSLQLVKRTFNTFKGLFRLRLTTFISRAVQISHRAVQLLQSRTYLLTFVPAEHATVTFKRFNWAPNFHGWLVYPVKILGLNSRSHVIDQLLYRRPGLNWVIRHIHGLHRSLSTSSMARMLLCPQSRSADTQAKCGYES